MIKIKTDNDSLETTTKTNINNLKTKVDKIDLTKYVLKNIYDDKIGNLELKTPDVNGYYKYVPSVVRSMN